MITDCHTHIDSSPSDNPTAAHAEAYREIDACFVLAASGVDRTESNTRTAEYAARNKGKIFAFAAVNPVHDKVAHKAVNAAVCNAGFAGAVLYCCDDAFHPAHSRAMRFYEAAQELNFPIFFHNSQTNPASVLNYAQPYMLDEIAFKFPDLKIIVGNIGLPFREQTIALIAKHKNVYADLTINPHKVWEVYNIVTSAYEASVMDKLIFGSGFPKAKPSECIETLLGFNRLLANTNLPTVPRERLRTIIERDTAKMLDIA